MRQLQCVLGLFTCLLVIFAAVVTIGVFVFMGNGVAIRHIQTTYEEPYYNYYLTDSEKGNRTLRTFCSMFQCRETKGLNGSKPHAQRKF